MTTRKTRLPPRRPDFFVLFCFCFVFWVWFRKGVTIRMTHTHAARQQPQHTHEDPQQRRRRRRRCWCTSTTAAAAAAAAAAASAVTGDAVCGWTGCAECDSHIATNRHASSLTRSRIAALHRDSSRSSSTDVLTCTSVSSSSSTQK